MNINLIPDGAIKRVHVSQNDVGRTLTFNLFNDSLAYTPTTGSTVKIQGTKPSGYGFSETCTWSGNVVTVDTTEGMTQEYGYIPCELQITKDSDVIGTSNFILVVERNPHPSNVTDGTVATAMQIEARMDAIELQMDDVEEMLDTVTDGQFKVYTSPLIASTVAQMTNTEKTYVYVGSETGYTSGNWYYYNGSSWVSGGVYNATAVTTDTTLTQSGVPADAKATGDAVSELNNVFNVEYSDNIFDNDATYTITEGKYLNPNTGNYGTNADFMVIEDYLTGLEIGEKYWIEYYNKETDADIGYYSHFICFYDSTKTFISGFQGGPSAYPLTVPANTVYYRLSYPITAYEERNVTITKGTTAPSSYIPYTEDLILKWSALPAKSYVVVDINGNGDYTTINDAVQAVDDDTLIIVMPGEYYEQVEAWDKTIHLLGLSKETTILYDDSMDYYTPPLEFASGSLRNMTIYAKDGRTTPTSLAYAMHVESHSLANSYIYCENVIFKSEANYCVGVGLRRGATVTFKNCDFIGNGSGAGSIFFHDADSSSYRGTAYIVLDSCNLITNGQSYPIKIQAINDDNLTYITFKRNVVWSKTNETSSVYNTWNTGGATGDGWRGLLKMYLTYDSVLNSESGMNYR